MAKIGMPRWRPDQGSLAGCYSPPTGREPPSFINYQLVDNLRVFTIVSTLIKDRIYSVPVTSWTGCTRRCRRTWQKKRRIWQGARHEQLQIGVNQLRTRERFSRDDTGGCRYPGPVSSYGKSISASFVHLSGSRFCRRNLFVLSGNE